MLLLTQLSSLAHAQALYKRVYPKFTTEEYTDGWDELPAKFLEAREAVEAKSGKEDDGDRGMDM